MDKFRSIVTANHIAYMPKILIVDDEALIRETLKDILEHEGYEIHDAPDGEMALKLIGKNNQKVPGRFSLHV